MKLNSSLRVQNNLVEIQPYVCYMLLIAGAFYSLPAIVVGGVFIIARVIYTVTYLTGGTEARTIGAALHVLTYLCMIGLAFASPIYWMIQGNLYAE